MRAVLPALAQAGLLAALIYVPVTVAGNAAVQAAPTQVRSNLRAGISASYTRDVDGPLLEPLLPTIFESIGRDAAYSVPATMLPAPEAERRERVADGALDEAGAPHPSSATPAPSPIGTPSSAQPEVARTPRAGEPGGEVVAPVPAVVPPVTAPTPDPVPTAAPTAEPTPAPATPPAAGGGGGNAAGGGGGNAAGGGGGGNAAGGGGGSGNPPDTGGGAPPADPGGGPPADPGGGPPADPGGGNGHGGGPP